MAKTVKMGIGHACVQHYTTLIVFQQYHTQSVVLHVRLQNLILITWFTSPSLGGVSMHLIEPRVSCPLFTERPVSWVSTHALVITPLALLCCETLSLTGFSCLRVTELIWVSLQHLLSIKLLRTQLISEWGIRGARASAIVLFFHLDLSRLVKMYILQRAG